MSTGFSAGLYLVLSAGLSAGLSVDLNDSGSAFGLLLNLHQCLLLFVMKHP